MEGQTEERFVKDILQPHLWGLDVHIEPTLTVTKRIKQGGHFKGGLTSFDKVKNDLRRLLNDSSAALVTTMFDLYGLPRDFPHLHDCGARRGVEKARYLESALEGSLDNHRFRSYLAVHEFEAMLYADPQVLPEVLNLPEVAPALVADRNAFTSPEDINDGEGTHPSRRLSNRLPGYRKRLHGPMATGRIGLAKIRAECAHFNEWMALLESFGS